jgi:hypothetical protein
MSILTFKNVIPGHDVSASVRITDDGCLLNVVDLVMGVTGNDRDYSSKIIGTVTQAKIFDAKKIVLRKTPGVGNGKTKFVSFSDAIELIMVLPGRTAKQIRVKFADIIVRYLDGDRTMCTEIEENHTMGQPKSYLRLAKKVLISVQDDNKDMPVHARYVYAVKSPAYPGLIKIGKTQDIVSRLSCLNVGNAPLPFVIVALAASFDYRRDELAAHAHFAHARREGEFFELKDSDVIYYFAQFITARFKQETNSNVEDESAVQLGISISLGFSRR